MAPPSDLFREHGEFLRRLALGLARRDGGASADAEADADDLVQETWLATLRRPPDPARPARPWLAEVLRNVWRMRHRGATRQGAREVEAESLRDAPGNPEQALARAEILAELSRRVGALAEPLRTTVLLRYGEGLTAAQIATLQGIPAGTVRWRLKAALDTLRAELDDSRGPTWSRAFLIPAGLGQPSLAVGALAMQKWIVAVVVLVLLGAGVWMWRGRGGGAAHEGVAASGGGAGGARGALAPSRGAAGGDPSAAAAAADATRADAGPPSLAGPGRPAVVVDDPSPTGAFAGRVINWSTGRGVAGAELAFASDGGTVAARSDDDGRFTVVPPGTAPLTLATATAPGFLPYAPEWGHSPVRLAGHAGRRVDGITVFLFPAVDYFGLVLDPAGKPVAGAQVRLLGTPAGEQAMDALPDRFTSDAQGRFTFHAPDDTVLEARAAGLGPGRARLDGQVAISKQLVIRLGAAGSGAGLGGERLAGRVVDGAGQAVSGALVRAWPVAAKAGDAAGVPPAAPPGFAVSDAEGRFSLGGLDAMAYEVVASDDEHAPVRLEARAGRTDLKLAFAAGATLGGRVVDDAGKPVPSFTLLVLAPEGLRRRSLVSRSIVDAEGRFEVAHLPAGEVVVVVAARGFAPSGEQRSQVPASGRVELEVRVPQGGTIRGRVTGAEGKPLEWARVMLEGPGGGASIAPANAGTVTDAAGEFVLTGVAPGRATLSVAAGDHHPRLVGGLETAAGASVGPVEVALRPLGPGETPTLELVGIGVRLGPGDDHLEVLGVIAGGGAEAAGIVAGDRLVAVDGAAVAQLGFDGTLARIRGAEGTAVRLGLVRGDGQRQELTVVRKKLIATP